MKDLSIFVFEGSATDEGLARSLHDGSFLANRCNVVLVGAAGAGKTPLPIAITANVVRAGARGRFFNLVDLVNRLEDETRRGAKFAQVLQKASAASPLQWHTHAPRPRGAAGLGGPFC